MKKAIRNNPVINILIGIVLLSYGIRDLGAFMSLSSRCTAVTTGQIYYNFESGYGSKRNYKGIASFKVNGEEYSFLTEPRRHKYRIGKTIRIKYDPNAPNVNYSPSLPPLLGIGSVLIGGYLVVGHILDFVLCGPFSGKRRRSDDKEE